MVRNLSLIFFSIFVGALVAILQVKTVILLFCGFFIFCISLLNMEKTILVVTVLRASFDLFRETARIGAGIGSLNITGFLSVLIICYGVVYFVFSKRPIKYLHLFSFLLCFLVVCFLSIFYSPAKIGAIEEVIRFLSYFTLAFLVGHIFNTKAKIVALIYALCLSLIVPLSVGFYQLFAHAGYIYGNYNRLYGTLQHPSSYGKFLILFFVGSIVYLMSRKTKKEQILTNVIFPLVVCQIIFTFTRAVWVECFLSMFILWRLTGKKLFLYFLMCGFFVFLVSPTLKGRFTEEIVSGYGGTVSNVSELKGSYKGRLTYNKFVLSEMFAVSPLIGKGIGSFYYFYAPTYFGLLHEVHGDFCKLLGETGLIGSFFFFLGFIKLLSFFVKQFYLSVDPFMRRTLLIVSCVMVLQLFGFFFDAELRLVTVQWYFWTICGIGLACIDINERELSRQV